MTVLVGGLLSFIPVLNFFAFGYLYRWSRQVRQDAQLEFQDWNDLGVLFVDGIRFTLVWLLYWLVPVLAAWGIYQLIALVGLGAVAYLFFTLVLLLAPVLMSAALARLQYRDEIRDLLQVGQILRLARIFPLQMLLPAMVAFALFWFCPPLYGFALFAGFLVVLAYANSCLHFLESSRAAKL